MSSWFTWEQLAAAPGIERLLGYLKRIPWLRDHAGLQGPGLRYWAVGLGLVINVGWALARGANTFEDIALATSVGIGNGLAAIGINRAGKAVRGSLANTLALWVVVMFAITAATLLLATRC